MDGLRIWNARTVDPASGTVIEPATIQLAGGRIVEVAGARGDAPEGAIDVVGRTVLPGLIDAHTHLSSDVSRSPGFGPPRQLKERTRALASLAGSCSQRRVEPCWRPG